MTSIPLVCLPPAGAGASFFHPWRGVADPFHLVPVDLPGRETRFADEPRTDMPGVIEAILPGVLAVIRDCRQSVIFGHSFGAVVAYELARRVSDAGLQRLRLVLVVSGAGRPGSGPDELISGLDDDHFLDQVRHRTGYSHPAFDDPEIRALLLPTLRADIALSERYRPHVIAPLPHPVLTLRGDADELVSAAQAAQWREMTSAEFVMRQIPGGHMYLTESWQQLLDLLRDECLPLLQPTSCPEAQDQAIAEPKHQSTCEAPRREGPYGDVID